MQPTRGRKGQFGLLFETQKANGINGVMAVIHLETVIAAPKGRVFDLARSIDAHQDSTGQTGERAVAGVTSGLLGPEQEVTWEARHFGVQQRLRVKMTKFERPNHFQDVMLEGAFRQMTHDHSFEDREGKTVMVDRFEFSSPLGFLGRIVDQVFLKNYMRRFIEKRNAILKHTAETDEWKKYLKPA
jgi:ligand-binding SRPBCC domain-containing protein